MNERFNRVDAMLDRILDAIEHLTLRVGSLEQKTAIVVTDIARLDDFNKRLRRNTGGLVTGGEQCAFAVRNCVQ